jgi:hypothetical protein
LARLKGSVSSKEAKSISKEIELVQGSSYRFNFDFLRLVELLIAYRVAESVCDYPKGTPIEDMCITVEIPLIGFITITPRVFHEKHRLTDDQSFHFDFEFKPSSGFKSDISRAFLSKDCDLADVFSSIYSSRLQDLYQRLKEE